MVKYKCAYCEFADENKEKVLNHILDKHAYVEVKGDTLVVTFSADKPEGQANELKLLGE